MDTPACEDGNDPSSSYSSSFLSSSPLPCADSTGERRPSKVSPENEENQNLPLEKAKFFRSCSLYRGGCKSSSSTPVGRKSNSDHSFPSLPLPSGMTSLMSSISKSYLARPRRSHDVRTSNVQDTSFRNFSIDNSQNQRPRRSNVQQRQTDKPHSNSQDPPHCTPDNNVAELWGFAAAAARLPLPTPNSFILKPPPESLRPPASTLVKPSALNLDKICPLRPPTLTFDEMRNAKTFGFAGLFTSHSFTGPRPLSHVDKTTAPRGNSQTASRTVGPSLNNVTSQNSISSNKSITISSQNYNMSSQSNGTSPPRSNPYSFPCDPSGSASSPASSCSGALSMGIDNEKALPGKL